MKGEPTVALAIHPSGNRVPVPYRMFVPTIVLAMLAVSVGPATAHAEPIIGRAIIIDGDTFEIRGQRVRLFAVDAPEGGQVCRDGDCRPYRCGQKAANALADRIGAGTVTCEVVDIDQYGRSVGVCRLGSLDLNGWLVETGLALAYQRYSKAYVGHEKTAREAQRGLWAGSFDLPWDWRRRARHGDRNVSAGRIVAASRCGAVK